MQTLTPKTTRSWIRRLGAVIENCNEIVDRAESIPASAWNAARIARTEAIIVRDELLEAVVSEVEVVS